MKILTLLLRTIAILVLTVLTQIGGLVYLLSFITRRYTDKWSSRPWIKRFYRTISFIVLYVVATSLIVPFLARPFGRVPLPITTTNHLRPLNLLTCLLNRHYVKSAMKEVATQAAIRMHENYPGTETNYLDANFPFFNGFPLIPHHSHNDGKKLDLAFYYLDAATHHPINDSPSPIGYGVCETPLPGEDCMPCTCTAKGHWQYSFLTRVIPQRNKSNYVFDEKRTKTLAEIFAGRDEIGKLFIEPHLKTRLKLTSGKVRFHGCQAVRHDDHLHIQLK